MQEPGEHVNALNLTLRKMLLEDFVQVSLLF